ncbi:MAG: hypothetical protein NXI23_11485 [Bacteroidetes bacterium]|nr:hypothetical protein [Bacteroidota bacterium]
MTYRKKTIHLLLILTAIMIIASCNKSDNNLMINDGEIEQINGITADELGSYKGDLGLLINTRDLIKKGYKPTKVKVTTTASEGNYDQSLVVDPFTNIAQLKISIEGLTEDAEDELRNGVGLEFEVYNDLNNLLISESYSVVSFEESGNKLDIDASSLEYQQNELHFKANMQHYLQLVDVNGNYSNNIVWKPSSALDNGVRLEKRASSFNSGTTSEQYFLYKFNDSNNEFAIYSANTNRYLTIGETTRTFRQSDAYSFPAITPESLGEDYRFIIEKEPNGLYTIRGSADGNPLKSFYNSGDTNWHTNTSGNLQYFRIIALDTEWETTELNTEHLQPIFPPVETSFGFNSTLKNCGSGSLEQQVGIQHELETTYRSSLSESIGLSGRVTTNAEVSVSATAEASFFGNGGSVTGEVSAGIEVSTEASSTTTIASEESVGEVQTFFSTRTVTVPAGRASLVYDAYQTYSNVQVPYVKRLRLKGSHTKTGETLTGDEIATQLYLTSFTGTITKIGSDYVELTIRGNMYLDNIVDTQTEVRDVETDCN